MHKIFICIFIMTYFHLIYMCVFKKLFDSFNQGEITKIELSLIY